MKIALASDHAGYALKEEIKAYLVQQKMSLHDFGCFDESRVDYPDFISQAAKAVARGDFERGIVFCGSGVGASIVANKVPGIRAVLCFNEYLAEYSRKHNNTNILALAGRLVPYDLAVRYVDLWLATPYEGGRHQQRLDKITLLEKECRGSSV